MKSKTLINHNNFSETKKPKLNYENEIMMLDLKGLSLVRKLKPEKV